MPNYKSLSVDLNLEEEEGLNSLSQNDTLMFAKKDYIQAPILKNPILGDFNSPMSICE